MNAKVYLIGAGCGDPRLISVRGAEILKKCACVIYDRLIPEELLELTPPRCRRIYAGKRAGEHYMRQEEINALILEEARKGGTIARLKGGDPFVFGRGGEEAELLEKHGIAYEVVPGISSAYAACSAAGIPVTHRGASRSFHVITAHTSDGKLSGGFEKWARLDGTLIFLMGLSAASELASGLIGAGMNADTPAAVISRAYMKGQKVIRTALEDLGKAALQAESPAVIAVGETAAMELHYTRPVRVGVTGTPHMIKRMKSAFAPYDVQIFDLGFSYVEPLETDLSDIGGYDTIVFTGANGVRVFFDKLLKDGIDVRTLWKKKFAAIGSGTAAELEKRGIFPDFMPKDYTVAALSRLLCEKKREAGRMLIFRAQLGSPALDRELEKHGAVFKDTHAYRLRIDEKRLARARRAAADMDAVTFASSSAARVFFEGNSEPFTAKAAAIGAETAAALREFDINPLTADKQTAESMAAAIMKGI